MGLSELKRLHYEGLFETSVAAFGPGSRIHGRIYFTGGKSIRLGKNVHIGDNAFIRGEGGLSIGDNTHISRNVSIYTVNHNYKGNIIPYDDQLLERPVVIEDNVWIGMNVSVVPGTHICEGSIIGIGATVAGRVPPLAIVTAPDLCVRGSRPQKAYEEAKQHRRYGGKAGKPLDLD